MTHPASTRRNFLKGSLAAAIPLGTVWTGPGATMLTVMPYLPSSWAAERL